MAGFGAQYPIFAPFAAPETDTAMPTYDGTKGVVIGNLVAANLTVTMASGEQSGDDKVIEKISVLSSGAIPMETVDIEDDAATVVYGATVVDGSLEYKKTDSPPFGGLCYYKSLVRGGKKFYKCYFYPKAQATIGNDNAQTQGTSITFTTATTNFTVFPPLFDDAAWMIQHTVDSISDARAWCREQISMTE